ncbi:MAG: lipid-A-disaccharide synthase [Oscillatoriaceae bacterium SKW80]|nr:lipid-A-disaccharide synthase [Oscillatoriaceae bacterium SKYG93]MCX8119569.1 lipid-A-disaccharide synthase [Oscillatoriaceae bacterium SKW80]MDW8455036.1 lipid-A-disaccharide synthase [Oscillatoriaceae cyanobacterium SKYGB_i_bin93]HIK28187.1 lipid-A-disaccharide synthase [Oscillatoriaceae cyanobacterium M7585_C2015_266]
MESVDILILSNGVGEVTTWVRPVVEQLRLVLGEERERIRISVILSPCPHATGKEAAIARSYPAVDRVQEPQYFWQFLFWGKTAENWDWRDKGIVIFLGGDQIYAVVIGKRLGYRTVVYAEWEARWQGWIDRFAVMTSKVIAKASKKYVDKFTIVGDLMAEAAKYALREQSFSGNTAFREFIIGLLPGSKPAKLSQGVPLTLAIAECIYAAKPNIHFVIPVAPTLDLQTLARFANPRHNPLIEKLGWAAAELVKEERDERVFLKTATGLQVELYMRFPAYDLLSRCCLCLTTVGANTAELGSLAVPMIVLLPTQQLDAMRYWDGLPGLLANLPWIGSFFAKIINLIIIQKKRLYAWPNIWAGKEIVPELLGKLQPEKVAQMVIDFLEHPEKLEAMRESLRAVRGEPGASEKIAHLVREELFC